MRLEDIRNIAVLGAGVMGNSIALVFAQKGYQVCLWSRTRKTLDLASERINTAIDSLVEFGRMGAGLKADILRRIYMTNDLPEAARDAHFAIESVAEVPEVKKEVFSQLDEICSEDSILSSNTSGLNVFELAKIRNPARLVITHWFSPPHLIPLVEVVPGEATSDKVLEVTGKLLKSVGKKPVFLKKFVPSFIVNRVQNAINRTILEMMDKDWATPESIDLAIKSTLGIRLPIVGIAQALDFTGLDLISDINRRLGIVSRIIEEKVREGHTGVKTSKGLYDYHGRSEAEILKKRDGLFIQMMDHLEKIGAFRPV